LELPPLFTRFEIYTGNHFSTQTNLRNSSSGYEAKHYTRQKFEKKKLRSAKTSLNLIQNLQTIREHLSIYNTYKFCHFQKTQRFNLETKQDPSLDVYPTAR
jgi:hypothetical protein